MSSDPILPPDSSEPDASESLEPSMEPEPPTPEGADTDIVDQPAEGTTIAGEAATGDEEVSVLEIEEEAQASGEAIPTEELNIEAQSIVESAEPEDVETVERFDLSVEKDAWDELDDPLETADKAVPPSTPEEKKGDASFGEEVSQSESGEVEVVPPGPIRRSLALVLRLIVRILNWVILELEAEDIRQQPEVATSLGSRLSTSEEELAKLTPLRRIWRRVLLSVRSLLPNQLREVSDRNLGIILATVLVVVGWTAVGNLLPQAAEIPEEAIAQVPPEMPVEAAEQEQVPEAPQLPDVVEITPEIEPDVETDVATTIDSGMEVEDGDELRVIAEAEDKDDATDSADETALSSTNTTDAPEPEKPPVLEMTPEQSLIAAIQDQVVETAQRYGDSGIVQSIQADFRQGRLLVRIEPGQWFELTAAEQDRMAADLFGRSLNLDFNKLEITTVDGVTLARSPVVGDTMVILQRKGIVL